MNMFFFFFRSASVSVGFHILLRIYGMADVREWAVYNLPSMCDWMNGAANGIQARSKCLWCAFHIFTVKQNNNNKTAIGIITEKEHICKILHCMHAHIVSFLQDAVLTNKYSWYLENSYSCRYIYIIYRDN